MGRLTDERAADAGCAVDARRLAIEPGPNAAFAPKAGGSVSMRRRSGKRQAYEQAMSRALSSV